MMLETMPGSIRSATFVCKACSRIAVMVAIDDGLIDSCSCEEPCMCHVRAILGAGRGEVASHSFQLNLKLQGRVGIFPWLDTSIIVSKSLVLLK